MLKKTGILAVKLLSLVLLCAVVFAVISYQKGYYDITFLPRQSEDVQADAPIVTDIPPVTTAPIIVTEPSNNVSSVTKPTDLVTTAAGESDSPDEADSYTSFASSLPTTQSLRGKGYARTDEAYDAALHVLTQTKLNVTPRKVLSSSKNTRSVTVWNEKTKKTSVVTEEYDRPTLELYMGLLFYDDGETVGLLDDDGKLVMVNFDDIAFAYERDAYNRPLFYYRGGYYCLTEDWRMVASSFNPAFGYPVKYDSPVGYQLPYFGLYRYYVEKTVEYVSNAEYVYKQKMMFDEEVEEVIEQETVKLYGFLDANGEVVVEAQYYYACNFGPEGLAVVADRNRVVRLINTKGREVINPDGTIVKSAERNNRNALMSYALPDSDGASSIGFYTFDHGLTRVRCLMRDYWDISLIVGDRDLLIDENGASFPIPEGYKLVSYADGILLLERDGRYGCLDYTGRWIAQPIYTYALPTSEGLTVLGFTDGKKGMIDTEGNIVIPFVFDSLSSASGGKIAAFEAEHGWSVFEKLGKE